MTARLCLAALATALASAACGDDSPPAGAEADAGADAAVSTATAFVVAGDFDTTGVASTVSVPDLDVTLEAVDGVASGDPIVRHLGDRLYIVNRLNGDNVTVLDESLELVAQISTGPGSNPQDVAAVGDTLFVAALNAPGILVLDLERPDDGVVDTIELSDLDPDGIPDCSSIVALGDQVVALCGLLDENFDPRGPGAIALIDGADRERVETAAMNQIRPFGLAQPAGDSLLIPTLDDFIDPTAGGCVERVLVTGDGVESGGCLADNADLGGFVAALAVDNDRIWMTVTTGFDPAPVGELVSVPAAGGPIDRVDLAKGTRPVDVALCPTGHLVLGDATQGVRVLAPGATEEITSGALEIGLPPISNGIVCH